MNVIKKLKDRKREDIPEINNSVYNNLRKNYSDLVDTILGENYYNLYMDIYSNDDMIADDIKREFHDLKLYKKMFKISLVIILQLLIALIILFIVK